jgi:hypothetical protein
MLGVRTLGLVQNDPQRGPLMLHALRNQLGLGPDADGCGVATLVDGSALVSRVRFAPAGNAPARSLAELLGTPMGRCTVVQLASSSELRPSGHDQTLNLGPFRARAFAAAIVGGPQEPDAAAAAREGLLRDLPDFLRRFVAGKSEGEAFFLATLAVLHRQGLLDRPAREGIGAVAFSALQEVLGRSDTLAGTRAPRQITFTDGTELLHVARGLPSAAVVFGGLDLAVADSFDPTLSDSSTGRERLRRFRGVVLAGGLSAPPPATLALPPGATLQVHADEAALLVTRELVPRPL